MGSNFKAKPKKDHHFSANFKGIIKWGNSKIDERHVVYALLFAFISALLDAFGPEAWTIFGVEYTLDMAKVPIILGGAYFGPILGGFTGILSVIIQVLFKEQNIGEMFNVTDHTYKALVFVAINYFVYGFTTGIIVGYVHCAGPKMKKMTEFAELAFGTVVVAGSITYFLKFPETDLHLKLLYFFVGLGLLVAIWAFIKHNEKRNSDAIRALDEILITEVILATFVALGTKSLWYIWVGGYDPSYVIPKQLLSLPIDVTITTLFVFTLHEMFTELDLE